MKNKVSIKKVFKIVGNIVTVIAIVFFVKKFIDMDINFSQFASTKSIISIIISCMNQLAFLVFGSCAWNALVYIISGKKIPYIESISVYGKSNILKYLPGNVFQYVGRNRLASDNDISHADVACSTILDTILGVIPLGLISAVFLSEYVIDLFKQYYKIIIFFIITFVSVVCFLLLILFRCRNIIFSYLKRYKTAFSNKENQKIIIKTIIFYVLAAFFSATINVLIAYLIFPNDTNIISIAGAYGIAWIIGFITPGAPGGVGVRESAMLLVCGEEYQSYVLMYALIYRLSGIISDIIGFIISQILDLNLKKGRLLN